MSTNNLNDFYSNYKPTFSLQVSQPYSLTNDFVNNRWTPKGTYWTIEPQLVYSSNSIINNNFNNNLNSTMNNKLNNNLNSNFNP